MKRNTRKRGYRERQNPQCHLLTKRKMSWYIELCVSSLTMHSCLYLVYVLR